MPAAPDELLQYVPARLARRLTAVAAPPPDVACEQFPAAVIFVDLVGFVPLSNRLARMGPEGAEELTRVLNRFYGPLVSLIHAHGGDVVGFAGDALLAVWPAEGVPLDSAVMRTAQAALEVQKQLDNFQVAADITLRLRVGIAAGDVQAVDIGTESGARSWVVLGEPLEQIGRACHLAAPGEVILSPKAYAHAADRLTGQPRPDGYCELRSCREPPAPVPLEPPDPARVPVGLLRRYLLPATLDRIDAGQSEWMADLRRVTVMFIKVLGLTFSSDDTPGQLRRVVDILQKHHLRYEGTLSQVMVDDKGTLAVCAFGLPPQNHEDDDARAILAALATQRDFAGLGLAASVGISTGTAFCGPLGSPGRKEYKVIGSVVNLAARLMVRAGEGGILCDGPTTEAAPRGFSFEELPAEKLKGFDAPVRLFTPTLTEKNVQRPRPPIVGRADVLDAIDRFLAGVRPGAAGAFVLEAEAGLGKSRLVTELMDRADRAGLRWILGECSSIEKRTFLFPWRFVLKELLGLQPLASPAARGEKVLQWLQGDRFLQSVAPLLNTVLGMDLPGNDVVDQLTGRTRADNLLALMVALLGRAAGGRPLVVILEDVHWLDSSSWELIRLVRTRLDGVSLVLTLRPPPEAAPEDLPALLDQSRTRYILLEQLSFDEVLALVRRRLGVAAVGARLSGYLREHAQGNPHFAEEIVEYLREAGLLRLDGGAAELRDGGDGEAGRASIPRTLRDVITCRLDQLSWHEQLAIKVASVIGRMFRLGTLSEVHPVPGDREHLLEYLANIAHRNLIFLEIPRPPEYAFKHALVQEVAYGQLPQAQRKELHRRIALNYEADQGRARARLPRIAYHWGRAGQLDRELHYLAAAGEEALRDGANKEAHTFLSRAIDRHAKLHGDRPRGEERHRLALLRQHLGEVCFHLGDLPAAARELEESLRLRSRPVRGRPWLVLLDTAGQLLVQLWHRLLPRRGAGRPGRGQAAREQIALTYERLAQIAYFTNDVVPGTNWAIRGLNVSEHGPQSPVLARSYAAMCIAMMMVKWRKMADLYARLAERVARETNHLPSRAFVLTALTMYWLGTGQWDTVEAGAAECLGLAERLGDRQRLAEAVTVLAMLACFRGDFTAAAGFEQRVIDVGREAENEMHQAWGLNGLGECRLRQGRADEAVELLHRAAALLEGKKDRTEEIRINGLLALAYGRLGRADRAAEYADRTEAVLMQGSHVTASSLEGIAALVDHRLRQWEGDGSKESRARALACFRRLEAHAAIFPIGRPRCLQFRGRIDWLDGQPARARAAWAESLRAAADLDLPMESALTLCESARRLPPGSPERRTQLTAAVRMFESLGMPYETTAAAELLHSDTEPAPPVAGSGR